MPIAGPCSAAISAACHRPEEDVDAATKPVMWGTVSSDDVVGQLYEFRSIATCIW